MQSATILSSTDRPLYIATLQNDHTTASVGSMGVV